MEEYIKVGKIVNTHGIKGEIRILSDFSLKDKVFLKGNNIYINKEKQEITGVRLHKNYIMITLKGIDNINEVLKYKGQDVYFIKSLLDSNILLEDLIGYQIVCDNKNYGEVRDIYKTKSGILLYIKYQKNYYIPYVEEFINKNNINIKTKQIPVERVLELL